MEKSSPESASQIDSVSLFAIMTSEGDGPRETADA